MSHAREGGQAPDQANSGRQTGAAVPPGPIIPKARNAASHPTSHKQHGDTRLATTPDRPTRRVSQSPLKRSNNIAARMGRWSASHWKTAVFGWLAFVVAAIF